ncbi:hypothetical protein [Clostridium botulinum]|uniref:hypothetical protein n=1 Tax=Clostridium botulinum TaxID=1491 RepID=UPI0019674F38|nr:hypothetical protein [Clostridium botulinum]MBN1059357.1 hypothetical protein [Clostridium botulinum]
MSNVDNIILARAKEYDYEKDVDEMVDKFKKEISEQGSNSILRLNVKFDGDISANTDEGIIDLMSKRLIQYRVREKAFVKLMREGLIYPINICNGSCNINKRFQTPDFRTTGTFSFPRIIFDEFMIM